MAKKDWRVRRQEAAGAIHVYPIAEPHAMTPECWCEPDVETVTADGVTVWMHHERVVA